MKWFSELNGVDAPHQLIVEETRRVLGAIRADLAAGRPADLSNLEDSVRRNLAELAAPTLQRVINATGVILHTNLGRAPLAKFTPLEGYSNLEYDLARGRRGKRDMHISGLLERLTGVPASPSTTTRRPSCSR